MDPSSSPKNQIPISVLLDCRTVVEKKDFVSTGILSYIEGDLIELDIGDYRSFSLGDSVKLKIYSPAGVHTCVSSVIAIEEGAVIILNPPELQKTFVDRREHARVEVECAGEIIGSAGSLSDEPNVLPEPIGIDVRNVSLGGIGLFIAGDIPDVKIDSVLKIEMDINGIVPCLCKVVRMDRLEDGFMIGTKYTQVDPRRLNFLRAFILRAQVNLRTEARKKPHGGTPGRKFK